MLAGACASFDNSAGSYSALKRNRFLRPLISGLSAAPPTHVAERIRDARLGRQRRATSVLSGGEGLDSILNDLCLMLHPSDGLALCSPLRGANASATGDPQQQGGGGKVVGNASIHQFLLRVIVSRARHPDGASISEPPLHRRFVGAPS